MGKVADSWSGYHGKTLLKQNCGSIHMELDRLLFWYL